mmetsp:Transcript_28963/g.60163  ORF Transcript_28963/g.60163 Transcript_28963/m.60163 type:complete len:811 (-) Transcript_28963:141-2573(-)
MASTSSDPSGSHQPNKNYPHQNTPYHPNPPQTQLGNLGNILTHYEYSQQQQSRRQQGTNESDPNNNYSNTRNHTMHISHQSPPGALTINIPTQHQQISSWNLPPHLKEEGERDRSSTLGSEFDLCWALGKDGRGLSISGLLTPLGERDEGMSESTATTAISGSTSTTANSVHLGVATAGGTSSHLPSVMENTTSINPEPAQMASGHGRHYATNENDGFDGLGGSGVGQIHENNNIQYRAQHNQSPSDQSHGSASMFLNGIVKYQDSSTGPKPSQQQRFHGSTSNSISIQQPQQQKTASQMISHTPPTHFGTSYENSHFGKRMRSGSISGRLRSASDLEDSGIISSAQKSVLKDLIIAGNDSVQGAIDKYESGDPSALEEMIKSGALAKSQDIDLLGDLDLDLDFLNVHEDEEAVFGVVEMDELHGNDHSTEDKDDHGKTPVQRLVREQIDAKSYDPGSRRPPSQSDDGIGDLEFNGYDSTADYDSKPDSSRRNVLPSIAQSNRTSDESLEIHRMRANSLAFPGFLLDDSNPEDVDNLSFGQWMDPDVARPSQAHANASIQAKHNHPPNIVDANGSLYILNPSQLTSTASNPTNGLTPTGISTPGASSFTMQCEMLMQREMQRQQMQQQQQQQQKHGITKGNSTKKKESKPKKEKAPKEKKEKKTSLPKEKKEPKEKKAPTKKKAKDTPEPMATSNGKRDNKEGERGEEEREEVPSGLGRPRTMSDPNLVVRLDDIGLLHVNGPEGWVGAYSPDSRQIRINKFLEKRNHRVWVKKVKYDVRKNFADSRLRVKGRFVKKEDEMLMRELMSLI